MKIESGTLFKRIIVGWEGAFVFVIAADEDRVDYVYVSSDRVVVTNAFGTFCSSLLSTSLWERVA